MSPGAESPERLRREIEHHRDLAGRRTEEIWGWASPAGRRRADRRSDLFVALGEIRPGRRVLELGCGTGEFTRRVAGAGAELTALDLSADLLAKAGGRLNHRARFVQGNAHELPFATAAFDAVYGCSILHHLDPPTALAEVRRVLRPGGRLVFSEPNLLNPQVLLMFKIHSLRPYFGNSPDEMAFTPAYIRSVLGSLGFLRFRVRHFDFLHPLIPAAALGAVERTLERLEVVPGVRAFSGSLLIDAER